MATARLSPASGSGQGSSSIAYLEKERRASAPRATPRVGWKDTGMSSSCAAWVCGSQRQEDVLSLMGKNGQDARCWGPCNTLNETSNCCSRPRPDSLPAHPSCVNEGRDRPVLIYITCVLQAHGMDTENPALLLFAPTAA